MVSRSLVLIIGVLFHLTYLRTIFDIYFKSPVVSVEEQFLTTVPEESYASSTHKPPADRLFLIVGDGLRADKLFENPHLAPFLHEKASTDGRWGISHTRVPTESRPGHVALIAGLYEDVSAVTTGWTLNPVKFDSVFNQTRKTWAWGSPDILPMFREGATDKDKILCEMYDPEEEDFTKESHQLDTWVFDRVNSLFQRAATDESLLADLTESGNIFFLHLLGLDSAGHAHRPYSSEYLNNIAVVDKGIAQLMSTLETTWSSEEMARTAFLFTADHGMSDWGSHGDGHPDNTRTPYITWGSGIRKPRSHAPHSLSPSRVIHLTTNETLGWQVESVERVDVAQADLAVLMSYLIDVPLPKNNVGSLPTDILTADARRSAIALFQNSRQIHAQYSSKAKYKADLLHYTQMVPYAFSQDFLEAGNRLVQQQKWQELHDLSHAYILESLEGMRYLQKYDWFYLRTIVTLGYLGWMLFALVFVLNSYVLPYSAEGQAVLKDQAVDALMGPKIVAGSTENAQGIPTLLSDPQAVTESKPVADTIFVGVSVAAIAYLLERSAPISHYAYTAFPLFFWHRLAVDLPNLFSSTRKVAAKTQTPAGPILSLVILGISMVQGIVMAYSDRRVISIMWPLASITPFFYSGAISGLQSVVWIVLCCTMSTFTQLPTVQIVDANIVVLGGVLMGVVGISYILLRGGNFTLGAQVGVVALTTIVTKESSRSLASKQGLPIEYQTLGWLCFVASLLLPLCHRLERGSGEQVHYQQRLMILFLTFAPTFIILSVSYEGLFYLAFWALLVTWLHLESAISQSLHHDDKITTLNNGVERGHRGLQFSDARIALYFFFLIQAAFFGTGNIASVSSFSLDSVYRLIPVFNPFAMSLLLLFKLLVPFAVISAILGLLNQALRVPTSAIFMTVLTFCDILTLNFFWMVRDEGSWLEIGSSISAFVIGGMLILFVISLEKVSEWMVGDVVM